MSPPFIYAILTSMQAWDIVCSKTLFDGRNSDGVFDDRVHLAEMIAIMGPPPADFIKRSKVGSVFWDEEGMFILSGPAIWHEARLIYTITRQMEGPCPGVEHDT